MLSEHEQRELRNIEQMLLSDSHLCATFRRVSARRVRHGDVLSRVLVGSGVLIMVCAVILDLGAAFCQGLGLAVGGVLWVATRPGSPARRLAARPVVRRD